MVKITLPEDNDQILAAMYLRYLPTEAELAADLTRERAEAERLLRLAGARTDCHQAMMPLGTAVGRSRCRRRKPCHYVRVNELGGFRSLGPSKPQEIIRRFGAGTFRVTAYGFNPDGMRWELLVEGLQR